MISIFFAYILNLILGSPSWLPNPVRGLEWVINKLEGYLTRNFRNLKFAGILLVIGAVGIVFLGINYLFWSFGSIHPALKTLVSVVLIYYAISIKGLKDEADQISEYLKKDDLKNARQQVSHIVGRDTEELDSEQLIKVSIESVAERTVYGVVSVLFYAFIGGPILAWIYKVINMLGLMAGYKNNYYRNIGWFSARLDDIFNYVPSRISFLLICTASYVCRKDFLNSFRVGITDGRQSPDSNSAIVEAAFAGALGVQLGGLSYYDGLPVHKPYLGQPTKRIEVSNINETVRLAYTASFILMGVMIIINYIWNII